MSKTPLWANNRSLDRLLAHENNLSDLLQFLSDRDPAPWEKFVGFVPTDVNREAQQANKADLFLTSGTGDRAAIEVKLGHEMDETQQDAYEALPDDVSLHLVAMASDEVRVSGKRDQRWHFVALADLFSGWTSVQDDTARLIAAEVVPVLQRWDGLVTGVFTPRNQVGRVPLSALSTKHLGRVVTRRIASQLRSKRDLRAAGRSGKRRRHTPHPSVDTHSGPRT